MAATARSMTRSGSFSGYAGERARWADMTAFKAVKQVFALADKHNGYKLGLILVGLWVANWLY